MSDYKLVHVVEQDVCFADKPKYAFTNMGLVLAVLNYSSEDPQTIKDEGGIPKKYNVRVRVEVKEI